MSDSISWPFFQISAYPSAKQIFSDRGLKEKLIAGKYNPADIPLSSKDGATCGMSMTEKQGGSDVRANTTQATPVLPGKEASGGGGFRG